MIVNVDSLAASVENTLGLYFVPALTGLFAPHWSADAQGYGDASF